MLTLRVQLGMEMMGKSDHEGARTFCSFVFWEGLMEETVNEGGEELTHR